MDKFKLDSFSTEDFLAAENEYEESAKKAKVSVV